MHMCATRPKWVNVIFTPGFTVISTPLKGTWYVECLFCYAWMIIIKSLFSRKAGSRRLGSLSSLVATWVVITTTCGANSDEFLGLSTGRSFVRRAPFNRIFTPVLLWYIHHGNVYENFVYCFVMLGNFSIITLVSFLTKRSVDDFTVLSSPLATYWHLTVCGATGDDGVALGLWAWRSLIFDARLT